MTERTTTRPAPRRVLVVSADMGGGHHAAGRAVAEAARRQWPDSQISWVDTLDAMGPGTGPALRRLYVTNVEHTPPVYEFFYASLWRHRWFAHASKRVVGAWAGRRLAREVERIDPDLIISTYPLGSAGLAWLRRYRGLDVPVVVTVSDFAPHPFWIYPELDVNLVVHPAAVPLALAAAPGARVLATAPPVADGFGPGDPVAARRESGMPTDRYLAVVSCGSYSFGAVTEATRALVDAGDPVHTAVVCGRNERLAGQLRGWAEPRLTTLGWVDDMAAVTRAADVVVTNAGGVTALEAMATGRPVLMYRPIAAHGTANAALMTAVGLAETCRTPDQLAAAVLTRAQGSAGRLAEPADTGTDLGEALRQVAATPVVPPNRPARRRSWPMRGPDAFFRHTETPAVPQQIGTVLTVAGTLHRGQIVALLRERLPAIPTLRRRIVARGAGFGWVVEQTVDVPAHVTARRVDSGEAAAAAIDEFWSTPLPDDRPAWQILLVTGLPSGETRLAVKLHHALCDGLGAVGTLERLLDSARDGRPAGGGDARPAPGRASATRSWRDAALLARGLSRLATAGFAPRVPLNRPLSPSRRFVDVALPVSDVHDAARRLGVSGTDACLGLLADALARTLPRQPARRPLRAMLPVSLHPRERGRTWGNWTAAATIDLPLAPMPTGRRVRLVADSLRRAVSAGEPVAAGLAMRAMGHLPAPIHRYLSRQVYRSTFFNVIVSHLPGIAAPRLLCGAPVPTGSPVVGLAPDVPVGAGVMRWSRHYVVGVLVDARLAATVDAFPQALRAALDEARAERQAEAATS